MSNHTPPFDHEHDLLDFADRLADGQEPPVNTDLESTVLRVQRSLRSDAADPDAMPADLKSHIWENIMQTTGAAHAAAPENPWQQTSTPPNRRARRRTSRVQDRPIPPQRMRWSGAANIALTVLLIVAAFGAVRAFEGSLPFGGNGSPQEPRYAAVPGTPSDTSLAAIEASPAATIESAFACDLSEDIPIIPDVSSVDLEGTVLTITPRHQGSDDPTGTLMLHCEEEAEPIQLAERVLSANPGPIPGVVSLSLLPDGTTDLQSQVPTFLNLQTGKTMSFGVSSPGSEARNAWSRIPGSPWVVAPDQVNPSQLLLANLETMEAWPLSDIAGFDVGTNTTGTGVAANGTTVLAFTTPYTGPGEGGTLMTDSGAPGDLMVLGDNTDAVRWINLPDTLEYVRDLWLSPDSSAIALAVYDGPTQFEDALTYAIVSADDGTLLGQSAPIETPGNPLALWVQDGGGIAYAASDTVQILRAEANAEPEVVLEPGQEVISLRTTYDPDTIVASIRKDHGSDADPASTDVDKILSVNVATGETQEFDGMEIGDIHSQMITQTNALFMYEFTGMESPVIVSAYDPVSGALIEELGELPSPHGGMSVAVGKNSFTSSPEHGTTVSTLGVQHILAVQVENGSPVLRRLAPPTEGIGTASAMLSPDGTTLSLVNTTDESRTRWLLDLTTPGSEWVAVPNEGVSSDPGPVQFVEGSAD